MVNVVIIILCHQYNILQSTCTSPAYTLYVIIIVNTAVDADAWYYVQIANYMATIKRLKA